MSMKRMWSNNGIKRVVKKAIESGEIELPPDVEEAPSGTIASDSVLGLDADGKVVKGAVGGGTKLYKHTITTNLSVHNSVIVVINN